MHTLSLAEADGRAAGRRVALLWRSATSAFVFAFVTGVAFAAEPDTGSFDRLLRDHVQMGVVDYPGFQDQASFASYLAELGKPASLQGRNDQLAHYINAYNALAIQGILDGLSPSTLLGQLRYFKLKDWAVDGRRISLYDLEHQVLRPLGEPRIHFAIVCASRSCPFLRSEAYRPELLDTQLDDQARRFINDPLRNRFDKATRTARLSSIFKWFEEDFQGAGSLQRYISRYVDDREVAQGLAQDAYRIEWLSYDWNLNGKAPRR